MDITHDNVCSSMLSYFYSQLLSTGRPIYSSKMFQYTEEKLGQAEKTELDAHFENLLQRADNTKTWTERILSQTEAFLEPNPSE